MEMMKSLHTPRNTLKKAHNHCNTYTEEGFDKVDQSTTTLKCRVQHQTTERNH